jgi:hypothetical protein
MYETKCPEIFNLWLPGDITGCIKYREGILMVNYTDTILLTMKHII